jgi:branched-chain amino acid transport system ATP-binding protein
MPADNADNAGHDSPATTATATTATPRVDVSAARAALQDVPHEPGAKKPDPIVVADGIRRTFGGLTAVDVDHLEIQRGVITGLIGPNGAGKTTFFNLLTGFDRPDGGDWSFNGRSLRGIPAFRVARLGMVRTFQLTKVLSKLTVLENMRVGATGQQGESLLKAMFAPFWRGQEKANTVRADALLERFLLIKKREDFAGSLSGGQRKLLELSYVLIAEPEIILLDEPAGGVNPTLIGTISERIRELNRQGTTFLIVEHNMEFVMGLCDQVTVLDYGNAVVSGPPEAIRNDRRVLDAYLGTAEEDDDSSAA